MKNTTVTTYYANNNKVEIKVTKDLLDKFYKGQKFELWEIDKKNLTIILYPIIAQIYEE